MARQLGHGLPLGAFRNLGSWVQRHSLGTSSLSILDLKTFYPRGFPAVESSAQEPQSNTSAAVARKIDTSAPALDTQVSSNKRSSAPILDSRISSNKNIPGPVSRKQTAPFRASLQRYFRPETRALPAPADEILSQKEVTHSSAPTYQVTSQPDVANPSTPDLQSASAETTASDPASTSETTANVSSTEPSLPKVIEWSKTSGGGALQCSVTEEIQTDESGSSQPSVADITHSIQSLQPSSSTPRAIHSELQRTTDIINSSSVSSSIRSSSVEPNTSIPTQQSAQRPGLASTDINQSIQSLREPSASIQRATEQHNQSLEQPAELRTVESKAPPITSPQLETQTAQQPKASAPSVQRLNESTETSPSSLSPNQNPGTASIHDQGQLLQRQLDSTTAEVPTHQADHKSEPVQQSTEQNATQPPNSGTAAISTHQAEPESGPVQQDTEQNPTTLEQLPSSRNDELLNTHARSYTASNQTTTAPAQLNVSPKIQTVLESSQIPSSPTSSNLNTVQKQPNSASKDPVNIDNSPPDNPSPTLNNLPQVQLTPFQQRTSQPSEADLIETISNQPTVTNSTESVQRVAESAQSPTSDSLDPSSVSAQNLDSIQPVSDITVHPAVNLPQAATSTPLVSKASSAIQRTPDQSNIISSKPTTSVQRSTVESEDGRSIAKLSISQEQADAIAPHPSAQTERSPNLSDTATSPTTDRPLSETKSVTSYIQSVANPFESIQRTADSTQSPKFAANDTIQTDITQLAADNLSETLIAENPSDSQPATNSTEPVQRVAELHRSTPPTSNPRQLEETQQPPVTSNPKEEGNLSTELKIPSQTSPIQRLPDKADNKLNPSPIHNHELSDSPSVQTQLSSLSVTELAPSVSAESVIATPSPSSALQRQTNSPQSFQSTDSPEVSTKATATVSNNQNTALSETGPVLAESATAALNPQNILQRHTKSSTSTDKTELQPKSTATVSNNKDTVALSETLSTEVGESVTTTSNLSSTLQRQTDSFQSADISPDQTESAAHVSGDQEAIEQPSVTPHLTRDISETSASSNQSASLQRQTGAPVSKSTPQIITSLESQQPSDTADIPLSSNVQRSLSVTESMTESDQPASEILATQKAPAPSKDPSTTPAKSQSTSKTQPWSPDIKAPPTAPSTASIQRVAVESRQNKLSDSNLSEFKQHQSTSSDPSDIQPAISNDSRSDKGNEISTERSASLLQRSPNIALDPIDAIPPLSEPGSKISSDPATTQRLSDTGTPPSLSAQPSKPRQHSSSPGGSVTSDSGITNQEVSGVVVQRSSNTAVTDSTLSLSEPLSNKVQLSPTDTHPLTTTDSRPPDAVSVQQVSQASSRQEASSYPTPQTQNIGDAETHHSQQSSTQKAANRHSALEKSRKPLTTPTKTHSTNIPETSTSASQSESLQRQTDAPESKPAAQISPPPEIQKNLDHNGLDTPLSSNVQRSLSVTESMTESSQPVSQPLTTQKAAALSKAPSIMPAKSQSTSESQPWSPDIEISPTDSSTASIQRVVIESLQNDAIQFGKAQSFESQPGQVASENIQRISDIRKTDFSKPTVESSQIDKNELSDSNLSEFKQSQSTSSDPSDIQRAVSPDSRSYKDNPSDELTGSPDLKQPAGTRGIQPSDSGNEVSAERFGTPLQRSSNIALDPIETTIRLSSSEISTDTAATQRLPNNVSDTIDSTKTPSDSLGQSSKTLQQEQSTSSRKSATSDSRITNQEVSDRVVQRSPNTRVVNSNLSLDESLFNKAQHSDTATHSLLATDSLQPDAVSVQRAPQASPRQEASSYPTPQTQNSRDEETHHSQHLRTQEAANQYSVFEKPLKPLTTPTETYPAPVSEPASAPNTESSPHVNSPSTSIQQSSTATRQHQSSISETSLQRSLDGDSQPEPTALAGKSLSHEVLGSASSNRLLPRVLQPLGVLKPLPSLRATKSAPVPSASPQTQLNTVQRQAIANKWAKNISSQEATGYSSPHPINPGGFQSSPSQDLAIPHMPKLENVNNSIEKSSDTNSTAANIQQASADTHSSIQRRGDSDNIPSEWSNLEDLVTHLQSTPPNQVSAKAAPTQQPPNTNKPTAKVAPQSEPQTVKLPKPATVTVQRQSGPPSTTKPTVIQACKDTSPDTDSANTDEQTDENHNYSQYLELLAQEVYGLLRQRLSLEQERRGPKYPR